MITVVASAGSLRASVLHPAVLWLVGLAALTLIFGPRAGQYYRPAATWATPAQR